MKKLLGGRIDLMMTSEKTFETMRDRRQATRIGAGAGGKTVRHRLPISTLPDELIAKMQTELDA